jgi:hypothetical protein
MPATQQLCLAESASVSVFRELEFDQVKPVEEWLQLAWVIRVLQANTDRAVACQELIMLRQEAPQRNHDAAARR